MLPPSLSLRQNPHPTQDTNDSLFLITEVECEVSSQVEYSLQAIWGVSIRELHLALWKPWSALRDASLNGTLLQGHAQYFTPPQAYPFSRLSATRAATPRPRGGGSAVDAPGRATNADSGELGACEARDDARPHRNELGRELDIRAGRCSGLGDGAILRMGEGGCTTVDGVWWSDGDVQLGAGGHS